MEEKQSKQSRFYIVIVAVLVLVGGYAYAHPKQQEVADGYAFLDTLQDTMITLTPQIDRKAPAKEIHIEDEGTPTGKAEVKQEAQQVETKQEKITQVETQEKKQEEVKKEEKPEEIKEKTKQEIVVKEEVQKVPEKEEIVSSNTQYIGNSGMVFVRYEDAQAFAKEQLNQCPDTIESYQIKESWEHPIDGNTQFTVDFVYVS